MYILLWPRVRMSCVSSITWFQISNFSMVHVQVLVMFPMLIVFFLSCLLILSIFHRHLHLNLFPPRCQNQKLSLIVYRFNVLLHDMSINTVSILGVFSPTFAVLMSSSFCATSFFHMFTSSKFINYFMSFGCLTFLTLLWYKCFLCFLQTVFYSPV
jgi:hypothetical protein